MGAIWSNMTYSVEYEMAPCLCAHAPNVADTVQWHLATLAMALRWLCADEPNRSRTRQSHRNFTGTRHKNNKIKQKMSSICVSHCRGPERPAMSKLIKLQSLQAWRSFEIHPQQRRSAQKNCCTCHDSRLMNRFDEEISWRDMNSDISDFMQNSCGRHWKSLQKFRGTPSVHCELAIQRWASVRTKKSTTSTTLLWGSTARPLRLNALSITTADCLNLLYRVTTSEQNILNEQNDTFRMIRM